MLVGKVGANLSPIVGATLAVAQKGQVQDLPLHYMLRTRWLPDWSGIYTFDELRLCMIGSVQILLVLSFLKKKAPNPFIGFGADLEQIS